MESESFFRRFFLRATLALSWAVLGGCATQHVITDPAKPGVLYQSKPVQVEEGIASWYGGRWIGRLTANGERYRAGDMTAAHKKLPFNTRARVVDLKSGQSVIVRINNRGPYIRGRIIDLSVAAARQLGTYHRGLARVRVEVLKEIPVLAKPNLSSKPRMKKAASTPPPKKPS